MYPEVDGFELLRRYPTGQAGVCKVLYHPVWGAAVYPASLFTNAPLETLVEVTKATSGDDLAVSTASAPPPTEAAGTPSEPVEAGTAARSQ